MKKHPVSRSAPKKEKSFLFSVFAGAVFSLALGLLLLALFCIPALALEDPLRFVPAFALISLFACAVSGARLAARLHGKSGLAAGVLSTLLLILLLVLLAFAFSLKIRSTLFFLCAPALLFVSAAAGIGGVSDKKEKRHRAHHHVGR